MLGIVLSCIYSLDCNLLIRIYLTSHLSHLPRSSQSLRDISDDITLQSVLRTVPPEAHLSIFWWSRWQSTYWQSLSGWVDWWLQPMLGTCLYAPIYICIYPPQVCKYLLTVDIPPIPYLRSSPSWTSINPHEPPPPPSRNKSFRVRCAGWAGWV